MSITVSPIAGGVPGIEITVTGGGAVMTAVTLRRTANGVTALTPVQPATGGTTATVLDYLLPWDADVAYAATVTTSGGTTVYTAASVNVTSTDAWAIHPVFPQLSVSIDRTVPTGGVFTGSWAGATRPPRFTEHDVIDAPFPVVTTVGQRGGLRGNLTLWAENPEDRDAVVALITDQTPILFRYPDALGVPWEDGFYAVADYGEEQVGTSRGGWWKLTLALIRTAPPASTVQVAWDYPTITATFADYAALTAAFADYPSLRANRRL